MQNPNIGFKIVTMLLHFYNLDRAIRHGFSEKALKAVSKMITSLRGLRRAIRLDINTLAFIKGGGQKNDEIKSY